MRIGILGATGMLGHHAALAARAAGHDVVVLHRASSNLATLGDLAYEARVADLEDAATLATALRGLDGLIHAAAYYPREPRPWRDEVATALRQMRAVCDAAAEAGVPRLVYLGGAIALARHPQGLPADETLATATAPDDRTPYVQVKWALDHEVAQRAAAGLPIVTAIPSMTFGEYDHGPTTGRLIVEIANRTTRAYVAGRRNAIAAGDAGRGLVLALERGRIGERYLLTGENVTMDDLVARIARLAGVPVPRAVPLVVARAVATMQSLRFRWLGGPVPTISDTAIAVMASGQFLDGRKARHELGFVAQASLDEALSRAYRWFVATGAITARP